MKISVGNKYQCERFRDITYHIIFRDINKDKRQFLGIREDGKTCFFDERGRDESFECGGNWYALDLTTGEPTTVRIEGLSC
jgi:hypothetical protein